MILTAHQSVYLPWLGFFHKIALSDVYVFLDTVQYLKKDWNNRNKIKTAHGCTWLTVPVITKGNFKQTLQEVRINNEVNWRRKHWQSIKMNYSKAPYFYRYADFFDTVYKREWDYLNDFNEVIIRFLLSELGIKAKFIKASEELKLEGYKSDLVVDLCLKLNAGIYIFGIQGKDYAEVDKFFERGIEVIFQNYKNPEYSQQFGKFQSNMSIIDLLFNHGDASLDILMSGNVSRDEILRTFRPV